MHPPGLTSFDEVRVEYDFDPDRGIYRASARILDPHHLTHDVYTLQSPLIHTREHALAVGRRALALLYRRSRAARKTQLPSRAELVAQGWPVMV